MSQDRSSCGPQFWSGEYRSPNAWAFTPNPFVQMMRLWSDSLMAFIPGWGISAPYTSYPPYVSSSRSWDDSPCAPVSVHTESNRPAEVIVNLDPNVRHLSLTADALRHDQNREHKIKAQIENDHGRFHVRVNVPDDYPAGQYRADIFDASDRKRGELRVHVREQHRQPSAMPLEARFVETMMVLERTLNSLVQMVSQDTTGKSFEKLASVFEQSFNQLKHAEAQASESRKKKQ